MFLLEDRRFYVYAYLDIRKIGNFSYNEYKFEAEPFYIGKGYSTRLYYHLKEADSLKNSLKNSLKLNIIRKIRRETGNNPIIVKIKEFLTEKESCYLENHLIKLIGRRDLKTGPLANLTDGGEGNSHRIFSEEHKLRISNSCKGRKLPANHCFHKGRLGFKYTEETKGKIKKAVLNRPEIIQNKFIFSGLGKKHSEEWKEKIRKSLLGKKHTEERKRKTRETKRKIKEKKNELMKMYPKMVQLKLNLKFPVSLETRKKMSEACKRRKITDSFRQKQIEINSSDWEIEINGEFFRIKNLKKFCKDKNIPYGQFRVNKIYNNMRLKKVESYV